MRGERPTAKTSALETLTGVPLPRQVNLCEELVTEITLKPAKTDRVTVKLIPGPNRSDDSAERIKAFNESITNFIELPVLMGRAADAIGPS